VKAQLPAAFFAISTLTGFSQKGKLLKGRGILI
jgi:hypothetical protein